MLAQVVVGGDTAAAQQTGIGSTPDATPAVDDAPQFALIAIGDFPQGYFADVEVLPGESVSLTVAVVNSGEVPVSLQTYKVNANNGVNGGYVSGLITDQPTGLNEWVEYPTRTVDIEPGDLLEIPFTVTVPVDATPGQYVSGLVAETVEAMALPGTTTIDHTLGYAISISVVVPGEVVHSFELEKPEVMEDGAGRAVTVPITNTGTWLVRPAGEVALVNDEGETVLSSPLVMGSLYGGLSTIIQVPIPDQMQSGDYTLDLSLVDEASGASAELVSEKVIVPEPVDPTGVSVLEAAVEPNAEEIIFANVDVTLDNGGQQIPASNVTLEVMRDGEHVDRYALATNQVLLSGENQFSDRYIPAEMWESGTYTFAIVVSAVDPNGGQETILLDEELDATITVP